MPPYLVDTPLGALSLDLGLAGAEDAYGEGWANAHGLPLSSGDRIEVCKAPLPGEPTLAKRVRAHHLSASRSGRMN